MKKDNVLLDMELICPSNFGEAAEKKMAYKVLRGYFKQFKKHVYPKSPEKIGYRKIEQRLLELGVEVPFCGCPKGMCVFYIYTIYIYI